MNVLQCPIEIAGQMGMLSKGLKEAGVNSTAYNTFHTYLGYRDNVLNIDVYELEMMMQDAIRHNDLFHFHYAQTMAPEFADLPEIRAMGKPMVMHHWGNDVRTHALATQNNPFAYTGDSPPPEKVDETLKKLAEYIDYAIVQDYEVYPYVAPYYKKTFILPIAIDVQSLTPHYPSLLQTEPLILHAPTNPAFKGTEHVEKAIERLRRKGLRFRYKRIEKMSNEEAMRLYREADIVIDQVLCGSYGMLAVESMSVGKPVVGYVREDLLSMFPEPPPIVSANPAQLYRTLKKLVRNPAARLEAGRKGREYVEKHHDLKLVTNQLLDIYQRISERVSL